MLDIDAGSQYHNQKKLAELLAAVETVGLKIKLYQSSDSGGWHLYIPLAGWQKSPEVEHTFKRWLKALGYEIKGGQLEVFPCGNALRLPLQPGFAWLAPDASVIRKREDITVDEALVCFIEDMEENAQNWQLARSLMDSQTSAADRSAGREDQAHQKAVRNEGFDELFDYTIIPEYCEKARQYIASGLTEPGTRHEALFTLQHLLWQGDPWLGVPRLPGRKNAARRHDFLRDWIEQNHNGQCSHINQGDWRTIEAHIYRLVNWQRSDLPTLSDYERYKRTERAEERLFELFMATGHVWDMDGLKRANDKREEEARAKIKQAVSDCLQAGKRISRRRLQAITGCSPNTLRKHDDLWRGLSNGSGVLIRGGSGGLALVVAAPGSEEKEKVESSSGAGCVLDSLRCDRTGQTATNSRQVTTEVLAAVHPIQSNSGVKHELAGSAPCVASGGMDCGIKGFLPASGSPPFNPRPIFSMGAPAQNLRQVGNRCDGFVYKLDAQADSGLWIGVIAHTRQVDRAITLVLPLERAFGYVPLSYYVRSKAKSGRLLSSKGYMVLGAEAQAMGNESHEKPEQERPAERQTEHVKRAQGEVTNAAESYTDQVKAHRVEKKLSGNSGATGQLPDKDGKGLASAKDLLGDDAHGLSKKEKQAALLAQIERDGYIVGKAQHKNIDAAQQQYGLGDDGRWHFQNPRVKPGQDIAGELKEWLWNDAVKDISNLPGAITSGVVNGTWALSEPLVKGINEWMQHKPEMTYIEFVSGIEKQRGRSPWRDVSFEGTDRAYSAFPELSKHNIPKQLISGVILNEVLHNGDIRDVGEDFSVQMFGTVRDSHGRENPTASVGPGQIQIQNIRDLVDKYPQLSPFKDDPIRAALDPEKAPMFVAAYLCGKIQVLDTYNKQHSDQKPIPIIPATLAYLYNPDVLSSQGQYRVIEASDKAAAGLLHMNTREGWHSENFPRNDDIIRKSKVVQDILTATKACYR